MTIPILPIFLSAALLGGPALPADFAFRLYHELRETEENLFFSPASIEAALGMVREGSSDSTLRQFNHLLGPHQPIPHVADEVTLESANAIWTDQSIALNEGFRQIVRERFDASLRCADFIHRHDEERQEINRWVEQRTRERIQNLLAPGTVNPETRMILVNAIYFKGDWIHAFDPDRTETAPFRTATGERIDIDLMQMNAQEFLYAETDAFQLVELPYQGNEISMLVLLPREYDGIERIEKGLSAAALDTWIRDLQRREVQVALPRFTAETELTRLSGILRSLGLTDAFDPERADFSGISDTPLFISDVVHKAFIQVDEEGTEAAAATGVVMRVTSMPLDPPAVFRADRPFIYLIRHRETGALLFLGRMAKPAK